MKNLRAALILQGLCLMIPNQPAVAQTPESNLSVLQAANLPAQKIGADDLIAVSVYDSPELTRTVRVSTEGQIRLPMLAKPIPAAGLAPSELEAAIGQALREGKILVDPVVTVTVAEYRSRPIQVAGAVKRPLTFQAFGNVTLLDAVTRAEGLAPEAGTEILLTQTAQSGKRETKRIPVKALLENADPEFNPRLSGGEEIRVPEAGKIYVVGSVKHPGAFVLKDDSGTSVLKVLALAEGLAPFASKQAYIYRRRPDAADKQEIPIALNQIIQRKAPDVTLSADDILYVPDAKGRRLSVSALERIAGFGAATTSGLLIWRR
ncbi:MAG TPA: polysaccharide biosynthesis/export family protein [Bryobacteraceae bacterium]|nr:polysaccharide biosynthesis/export family protein [Bryobacteraceae bacterium]